MLAGSWRLVSFGYESLERKLPESTGEEINHGICRLSLRGGGDVGVGVQNESGAVVIQLWRRGPCICTVLQGFAE